MKTILGIFFAIFGLGIILMIYQESRDAYFVDRIRFQSEFGQPAEISELGLLARKNRELVIWEKIRDTASSIVAEEALAKSALTGLEAERNRKKLARMLRLAWQFGQFEEAEQTERYGFLSRLITDDGMITRSWSDIYLEIEEMRPR